MLASPSIEASGMNGGEARCRKATLTAVGVANSPGEGIA
jgi:hypothetical protein